MSTSSTGKQFRDELGERIDRFVRAAYGAARSFPREELYGVTSQSRRAGLSVMSNCVEGCARGKLLVHMNFPETSYGSLKESKYVLEFSRVEGHLSDDAFDALNGSADEIGAMLWSTIGGIKSKNENGSRS